MKRLLVALVAVLVMLRTSPGEAHRISTRGGPPPNGVSIPSLTHGQMAVISDNVSAIRALAASRVGFDMTTWRLEDYANLQSFACLWGVVPGSITDEDSPFQRVLPRLSRRRACAPLATARGAGRQSQRGRGADPQDRGGDAGPRGFAHALPLQRRAVQHQRRDMAALEPDPFSSADRRVRRGRAYRDRRCGVGRMAQASREAATGGGRSVSVAQLAASLVARALGIGSIIRSWVLSVRYRDRSGTSAQGRTGAFKALFVNGRSSRLCHIPSTTGFFGQGYRRGRLKRPAG